ncbi:MAG TPA: hypothetical protein VGR45_07010 [Stellaceae bacterium]|nr:hypothetical protein [Stellaceae bacterium]
MSERVGLDHSWRASEIEKVAREAEDAGFDAISTTDVNCDALATAQLMGGVTREIKDTVSPGSVIRAGIAKL